MEPKIILLLGSFDEETKEVLNAVKNSVFKLFSGIDLYCFLLDDVELYASSDGEYGVMIERYDRDSVTIFLFDKERRLLHTDDIKLTTDNIALAAYEFIKNWCNKMNRVLPENLITHPILMKLELLFIASKIIMLIRHKENTRGGEYIELAHGISKYHDKFYFFTKNDISLSIMVDEILKKFNVAKRNYIDNRNLLNRFLR